LEKKEAMLNELQAEFQKLLDFLAELENTYNKTNKELESLKTSLEQLQTMIDRGDKLISGLQGEKTRWEATLIDLDE
jgi:dynein heavy chain